METNWFALHPEDSVSAVVQYDIADLLQQAGARPRGKRFDCPKCSGIRTVTHTDEVFFCHKCQWKGNAVTLAQELGVYHQLSPAEYRELCQRREGAHDAAERLYAAAKARRFELLEELHTLNQIEAGAHRAGPTETAWDALALVYGDRPGILAELTILENATASDLTRFLAADDATRQWAIHRVIERGGMFDSSGKFVEVNG